MRFSAPPPLRLRPDLDELAQLVSYIEAFAEQHTLGPSDTYALNLAAEELFANTVKHSHPPATLVEFSLRLDGDTVRATYLDDGAPYDPTQNTEPDTALGAEDRPIGGLGIHFIRKAMQNFSYSRQDGCNRIGFSRRLTF